MTDEQRETLDILVSMMDNVEYESDGSDIVVSGDDIDGPRVCYISPTGHTDWMN